MQIPSAMSSGVQGLQSAQSGLTQATIDVAKPTQNQQQATTESSETLQSTPDTDKTSALLAANQAVSQGEAATEVIEAGSETVGSIINIKV